MFCFVLNPSAPPAPSAPPEPPAPRARLRVSRTRLRVSRPPPRLVECSAPRTVGCVGGKEEPAEPQGTRGHHGEARPSLEHTCESIHRSTRAVCL